MLILSASISSYVAAVALYHSQEKRALPALVERIGKTNLGHLKIIGWSLLIAALLLCLFALGTSRGISVWLGIVSVSGLVSLIWATLRPKSHLYSILLVGVVLVSANAIRVFI